MASIGISPAAQKEISAKIGSYLIEGAKHRYKILTSNELYTLFLEILKGNNTYPKLEIITDKQRAHLVETIQPLRELQIIEKKKGTGVPGTPAELLIKKIPLIILIKEYCPEKKQEEIEKALDSKELILQARNFDDLINKINTLLDGKKDNTKLYWY